MNAKIVAVIPVYLQRKWQGWGTFIQCIYFTALRKGARLFPQKREQPKTIVTVPKALACEISVSQNILLTDFLHI